MKWFKAVFSLIPFWTRLLGRTLFLALCAASTIITILLIIWDSV